MERESLIESVWLNTAEAKISILKTQPVTNDTLDQTNNIIEDERYQKLINELSNILLDILERNIRKNWFLKFSKITEESSKLQINDFIKGIKRLLIRQKWEDISLKMTKGRANPSLKKIIDEFKINTFLLPENFSIIIQNSYKFELFFSWEIKPIIKDF